jgi:thiol-disulfide isomerase/thioredoxin
LGGEDAMKVIKIGAVWCSTCLVMKPRWSEIEKENPWLKTQYLDYDQDKKEVEKYDIGENVLPVFIFLDNKGKELERLTGELKKKKLLEIIEKYKDI